MDKDFEFRPILSEDCWLKIFSYLDFTDQLQLAKTSNRLCEVFKNFARFRYKDIDASLANQLFKSLGYKAIDQFLQIIGEHIRSYTVPTVLNQYPQIFLNSCHFASAVKNCPNLECFTFNGRLLDANVAYEIICQLPRLHSIYITIDKLRSEFLDALEVKRGAKINTLSIMKSPLSNQEVERICGIYSLKKLQISCQKMSIKEFLGLEQLETLHLTMPSIRNEELMNLVSGLPNLRNLELRNCSLITYTFLVKLRDWVSKNRDRGQKLWLYVQGLDTSWEGPGEPYYAAGKRFVMVTELPESVPVLLSCKPIYTYY